MRDRDIYDAIGSLHNFGTTCLSISEAAEVITLDMWYSGLINKPDLKEHADNMLQDDLLHHLSSEIGHYKNILPSAVESGSLKTERVRRDTDGNVICSKTYIDDMKLKDWVEEHGITLGDFWRYDYMDDRNRMHDFMVQEAVKLRRARHAGMNIFDEVAHIFGMTDSNPLDNIEPRSCSGLYKSWASLVEENLTLRARLDSSQASAEAGTNLPIVPRTKNTLLLIVAALCEIAKISPNAKGTVTQIKDAVEILGCKLSDDGIRNYLKEIPDVLERRGI